jgi:hypothetical protein
MSTTWRCEGQCGRKAREWRQIALPGWQLLLHPAQRLVRLRREGRRDKGPGAGCWRDSSPMHIIAQNWKQGYNLDAAALTVSKMRVLVAVQGGQAAR